PRGRGVRATAPAVRTAALELDAARVERVLVDLPLAHLLVALGINLPAQLLDELVDRRLHVARRLAGAQRVALEPDRGLCNLVRGDGRIAFHCELDLDARGCMHVPLELRELALRVGPDRVAHLEVLALDVKLHSCLLSPLGSAG